MKKEKKKEFKFASDEISNLFRDLTSTSGNAKKGRIRNNRERLVELGAKSRKGPKQCISHLAEVHKAQKSKLERLQKQALDDGLYYHKFVDGKKFKVPILTTSMTANKYDKRFIVKHNKDSSRGMTWREEEKMLAGRARGFEGKKRLMDRDEKGTVGVYKDGVLHVNVRRERGVMRRKDREIERRGKQKRSKGMSGPGGKGKKRKSFKK
ncbi:hypothetical protein ADUPG1_007952 [Aduncisulcus paluster]|uniref:Uncharacterized protein n=1 Tax=Aduncisulcus paluster TaxID=2918883 RepID=A0ABQ5KTB9_9EUKA|nr:hypothetical protein ADUPG1_007952 [Aduncisulcus paluster]